MPLQKNKNRKHQYSQPMSFYEKLYGWTTSTINNYKRRGLSLDDPVQLLAEVLGLHGKKPPLKLLQKEAAARGIKVGVPTKQAKKIPTQPPEVPELESLPEEFDEEMPEVKESNVSALTDELNYLKKEVAKARKRYQKAVAPGDKVAEFKLYKELLTEMRQLAKAAPNADLAARNSLSRSEVEAVWSRATKEFRVAADSFARRIATHPVFRRCDPVEVELVINREKDLMLNQLLLAPWTETKEASNDESI